MYSKEYRCTILETKKTTRSIVADKVSNKKTQPISNMSTESQLKGRITRQVADIRVTSKNVIVAISRAEKIANIETIEAP